jgi:hypothetical protein
MSYRLVYAPSGRTKSKGPFVGAMRLMTRRLHIFRTQASLRGVKIVSVASESY